MAKCKYPNEVCANMTVLNGVTYCDSVPCSLKDELPKQTISDKIRSNDDMYMSVQIAGCIVSYLVQNKIVEGTEADHKELISGIADDILEWLQAEVKEGNTNENT